MQNVRIIAVFLIFYYSYHVCKLYIYNNYLICNFIQPGTPCRIIIIYSLIILNYAQVGKSIILPNTIYKISFKVRVFWTLHRAVDSIWVYKALSVQSYQAHQGPCVCVSSFDYTITGIVLHLEHTSYLHLWHYTGYFFAHVYLRLRCGKAPRRLGVH